jgi:hypothetical protein
LEVTDLVQGNEKWQTVVKMVMSVGLLTIFVNLLNS